MKAATEKSPQDAAGGLLKNQADMAIVRGKAEIRRARDQCNFAEAKLKTTRSHNCKRRIFKYIEEVERSSKSFQPKSRRTAEESRTKCRISAVFSVFG